MIQINADLDDETIQALQDLLKDKQMTPEQVHKILQNAELGGVLHDGIQILDSENESRKDDVNDVEMLEEKVNEIMLDQAK
jgi:hypothetical protein